jgi:hypothetical protein
MNEALKHLDAARTKTIVLKEFIAQFEGLKPHQHPACAEILKEIDEQISQAYVLVAAHKNKEG